MRLRIPKTRINPIHQQVLPSPSPDRSFRFASSFSHRFDSLCSVVLILPFLQRRPRPKQRSRRTLMDLHRSLRRITREDFHQSAILPRNPTHSQRGNGEYRPTLYPTMNSNPTSTPIPSPPHGYGTSPANNSPIAKLIRSRRESETN